MDYLVKNMSRARVPGSGEGNKGGSSRERKVPLQRTQSFKGERKGLSWIRRQFTSRMSRGSDVDDDDPEYATAVAAAAYAITSLQETRIPDQKKKSEGPESAPTVMSKKSAMAEPGEPGGVSMRVPAPNLESGEISVGISEGRPEGETPPPTPASLPKTQTQKPAIAPEASLKKVPTEKPPAATASSTNKPLNTAASRKQPIAAPKPSPPLLPPPPPPPPPSIKGAAPQKDRTTKERPIGEIEIDAWEKAEMAKIKEKFDKVNSEITSWADKKKSKAKRKLDKTEAALDKKRAKALKHYRTDIQNIDYVAGGARAQADEKRRNDELKVKEKARMIRETGQFPRTCFCF